MDAVLMPHTVEQTVDGDVKLTVFDCPFAPMAGLLADPMACEICVGYVRGAAKYVTGGRAGVSRVTHIPAGDEKCDFYVKEGVPHGLTRYEIKAQLPPEEYISTLLSKDLNFVKENYLPKALSNPRIVDQTASEDVKKEQALAYLRLATAKALDEDGLMIHGFCAHLIPAKISHVLRVCLIADMPSRLATARGLRRGDALHCIGQN